MFVTFKKNCDMMTRILTVPIWLLVIMFLVSCSKDIKIIPAEGIVNHPPSELFANVTGISPTTADIAWSASNDPDNDVVLYRVYLDDTLYASGIQAKSFKFQNLAPARQYSARVVAYDRAQASTSCLVEIHTLDKPGSESSFLQILEFGQTEGSSAQEMGNMIRANDGGFIMTGKSSQLVFGNPGIKLFAMKIDSLGNKLWTRTYRYVSRGARMKIVQAPGGYIIVGGSQLLRLDNNGNLLWDKEVPTSNHAYSSATVDRMGQIYVTGSLFRDSANNRYTAILLKFDSQGNQIWEKKYSPTIWDMFTDVKLTADGNHLLLAGVTDGNMEYNANLKNIQYDFNVYKLTLDGSIVWKHNVREPGGALEGSLIETKDGNVVLIGGNSGSLGILSLVLTMIDGNGATLWNYRNDELAIYGQCVAETTDNNLIITGYTDMNNGTGFYLAKFSKAGTRTWYQHFYESGATILPMSVISLGDGGYFVNSRINDVIGIFRTNPEGKFY